MADEQARIESMQNLLWVIDDVDQMIENALLRRASTSDVIPRAMDRLLKYCDARVVTVRVPVESGEYFTFSRPEGVEAMADQVEELDAQLHDIGSLCLESETGIVYGQRLDLGSDYLGSVVAHFDQPHDDWKRDHTQRVLYHWAEIVDNYVASIVHAHRKQEALREISDAFKSPLIEVALDQAIEVLGNYVDFDTLLVVCQSGEVLERSTYAYRFVVNGDPEYSSTTETDPRVQVLVEDAVARLLRRETVDEVLEELGIRPDHLEDLPILGLDGAHVIGRIILGASEPVPPVSSDLLDRFADYLRQRVVDFSREWRSLSREFPKTVVERLLREPDYVNRFLSARDADVAMLYTDISGFTRLSEQVLKSPTAIGRLIDRWSRHVVEIIWEEGGVFDKMVGDCVIGLWGPPFYDISPERACRAAATAARRIRDFTAALADDDAFAELRESPFPVGVASGLNYGRVCVGRFGPDDDFTAFGSEMNNTARLQHVAEIHQILCMDHFVEHSHDDDAFGEEASARVKNVAEPLRFRPLQ